MEKRLERVLDTLQILQPLRPEENLSLRKTMEKAEASLLTCLEGKSTASDCARELRRRIEGLRKM